MAFDRLQKLGKEKFQKILNELARGTPAQALARLIQQEWFDAQDVCEETLARQLKRLSATITNGAFGCDLAEQAKRKASVRIKVLHGSTLDCLDELVQIAAIQRSRMLRLWEKERMFNVPLMSLTRVIRDYSELIVTIQEVKFNLGLDEYKRTIPVAGMSGDKFMPDGTTMENKVREAVAEMNDIFTRRGIPYLTSGPPECN